MAENWTPGPWKNDNGLVNGRMSDGRVSFDIFDAAEWPGDEDEAHANAHLIAAAPAMYDALKALHLQALQSSLNDPANEWGREALDMASAALSKARGED